MSTGASLAGRRVLVAEDDYFIARSLSREFKSLSIDMIGPAPSVREALNLVATESLDGAILNVDLRGEVTYSVADALAERSIPFLFATGYSIEAIAGKYKTVLHFEKPVRGIALLTALFAAR